MSDDDNNERRQDAPPGEEDELREMLAPLLSHTLNDESVPSGFVDRVVAQLHDVDTSEHKVPMNVDNVVPLRVRIARHAPTAIVSALAAALLVLVVQTDVSTIEPERKTVDNARGQALLRAHDTVNVGRRGLAVAETDAHLQWSTADNGGTVVVQNRGRVFYRVDKDTGSSSSFLVRTPGGDVHVTGTCFSVEVDPMTTTQQISLWNKGKVAAAGAVAGAVLTGAVLVTVFEGRVDVKSPAGERIEVGVGEASLSSKQRAAMKVIPSLASLEKERDFLQGQRRELRSQVDTLEDQLKVFMVAKANGQDPQVAENRALKSELDDVRTRLSAYESHEDNKAGKAFDWPQDIDPMFEEDHIKQSLLDSIRSAGLDGDIDSIDCTEFPCVAFLEFKIDGDREVSAREMKKFSNAIGEHFPKDGVSRSNSTWSKSVTDDDGTVHHVNNVSISMYPDVGGDDEKKQMRKRMRYRMRAYSDSLIE